jgi:uncharacterized protein (DUF427 family)
VPEAAARACGFGVRASDTHTTCGWKGVAAYWHVTVCGQMNKDAAKNIEGYVAFWKGVRIES